MIKKILLATIIVLAFVLRFYKLESLPALNADEAAIGYNAYSLLQTGKDEHGNPWPIHFQSFNDYKPGMYFYIVLPFVKVLGLNVWSVRIPGALLGVASVYLVYLLATKLSAKAKTSGVFPVITAFFLAISPWHIHFSRGGWEVNVATFFIILGVYAFLKFKEQHWWIYISIFSFVASLYTYHSARIVAPLLGLSLAIIYRKTVFSNVKKFVLALILGFIVTIPLLIDFMGSAGISRAAGVGLFADPGPLSRVLEQRGEHLDYSGPFAKLLHNKPVNYGLAFSHNYLSHFWGEFLFLSGDVIQRNRVPETGQLYLYDLVFVLIGVFYLLKRPKNFEIIIIWLIISPIAASLTFQSPHALRAQNMVIPLVFISAAGFSYLYLFIKERLFEQRRIFFLLFSLFICLSFARYLHMYYVHMAKEYIFSSQYGLAELADYLSLQRDKYQKTIITDRYDQPYILMLFYLKYSPEQFQNEHELTSRDQYGFSTVRRFSNFEFASIDYDQMRPNNPNSLLIGTDEEIPSESNIIKKIYGTNGHLYFEIVEN